MTGKLLRNSRARPALWAVILSVCWESAGEVGNDAAGWTPTPQSRWPVVSTHHLSFCVGDWPTTL